MSATATDQTMSGKYFLQLMKTASLEDFLRESAEYFFTLPNNALFKKKDGVNHSEFELLPVHAEVAKAFVSDHRLGAEFSQLPTGEQFMHLVKNPFLWDVLTVQLAIETSSFSIDEKYPWIEYITQRNEEYQKVFWKSFLGVVKETTHFLPDQRQTRLLSYINIWFEAKLFSVVGNAEQGKVGLSYFLFLSMYSSAVLRLLEVRKENQSDAQQLLLRILGTVDFHPVVIDALSYPLRNDIPLTTVGIIMDQLVSRANDDKKYFSWSLYERVLLSCISVVFHRKQTPGIDAVITYIKSVYRLADAVKVRYELEKQKQTDTSGSQDRLDEYCYLMRNTYQSYAQTKAGLIERAMTNAIWPIAKAITITRENLNQVLELQELYYSTEWHKQFEKITTESYAVCMFYIRAMDGAMKRLNRGWHRDDVITSLINSEIWKDCTVENKIISYQEFRSPVMYKSILQCPDTELPFEWMQQKHLLSLCQQK